MMSMGNVLVASEAFALGVAAGVEPDKLYDVLSVSGGRSHHFTKRFPNAIKGDFSPGIQDGTGREGHGARRRSRPHDANADPDPRPRCASCLRWRWPKAFAARTSWRCWRCISTGPRADTAWCTRRTGIASGVPVQSLVACWSVRPAPGCERGRRCRTRAGSARFRRRYRSPSRDCPRASPPAGRRPRSPCRPARSDRDRREPSGAQPTKSLVRLVPQPKADAHPAGEMTVGLLDRSDVHAVGEDQQLLRGDRGPSAATIR